LVPEDQALVVRLATPVFALIASLLLMLVSWGHERPAVFEVIPDVPAFRTPPSTVDVWTTVWVTAFGAHFVGLLIDSDQLFGGPGILFLALYVMGCGHQFAGSWHGRGVQLSPDGVRGWNGIGSLTVPWEALAPGHPLRPKAKAPTLALTYARPELIRRHGVFGRRKLRIDQVDAWFVADAIRYYVEHPGRRLAIGTPAEYRCLLDALTGRPRTPAQPI